jgi:D-arabinose 1-dehydrogenase-like Zn-dependent alcohol dehydrogenase
MTAPTPLSTRAIVTHGLFSEGKWALETVTIRREPGPDEVLVQMVASGICHSDLLLGDSAGHAFGSTGPKVLGHEGMYASCKLTVLSFRGMA